MIKLSTTNNCPYPIFSPDSHFIYHKVWECFEKKDEQQTALEKIIFGECETLREMATDHPPKKRFGLKDII